jgi:NAD(P)-dependent dehydrogenase (short-subunit alcohol dehydrogenase family)
MSDSSLKDRVAIVTGGARGIGRGISKCLAEAGADVVIADIRPDGAAEETVALVQAAGRRAVVKAVDVSNPEQVTALVQSTVAEFGHLDIMVANAGIIIPEPFLDLKVESWHRVLGVDLHGVFYCTQAAARAMVARGQGGKIVIISSVHSEVTFPKAIGYDVAKAGVVMLARGAARELAAHHINVNAIGPGWIDTPINREALADPADRAAVEATIPWGRIGRPEDIGDLATFLASDRADYITGAYFRCDGGFLLSKE